MGSGAVGGAEGCRAYTSPTVLIDALELFTDGGIIETTGTESGDGQLNEKSAEGAGLVLSSSPAATPAVLSGVEGILPGIAGTTPFMLSSTSTDLLAFVRRK